MIEQMEHNFIGKQIVLITDRAPEKCTWPCLDRKSVSPDENLVNLSRLGRIALATADPSREQVRDRSQDTTAFPARRAPLEREFAPGTKSNSMTDWAGEIRRLWAKGNTTTLDLARVVSAAKHRLQRQYGQWTQLWKSEQKMPVSKRTADMLAVIGDQMGGLDSQTSANLPRGWNILYHLARLDRQTLERFIRQGVVHPKLTLREAKDLVGIEPNPRKPNVRERLRRFAEFVRDTVSDWESDERELATEALTQLIEEIGRAEAAVLQRDLHASTFTTHPGLLTDPRIKLWKPFFRLLWQPLFG